MAKVMTRVEAAAAILAEQAFNLGIVCHWLADDGGEWAEAVSDPWVAQCAAVGADVHDRVVFERVYQGSHCGTIFRVAGRPPYRAMACVCSRA